MTLTHFEFNMNPDPTDESFVEAKFYFEFLDDDGYIETAITLGSAGLAFEEYSAVLKTISDYYLEEMPCRFALHAVDLSLSRYCFELLGAAPSKEDETDQYYSLFKIPFNTLSVTEKCTL